MEKGRGDESEVGGGGEGGRNGGAWGSKKIDQGGSQLLTFAHEAEALPLLKPSQLNSLRLAASE